VIEREGASDIDAQLLQVEIHLFARLGQLIFEVADFILHRLKIDLLLGLEVSTYRGMLRLKPLVSISSNVALCEYRECSARARWVSMILFTSASRSHRAVLDGKSVIQPG
jgi:hypothetical protein